MYIHCLPCSSSSRPLQKKYFTSLGIATWSHSLNDSIQALSLYYVSHSNSMNEFHASNLHAAAWLVTSVWLYVIRTCETKSSSRTKIARFSKFTRGKKFSVKIEYKREWWKHQKTILLQTCRGKERLEDSSISVAKIKSGNRRRVVFQSFFTTTCLRQVSLLVFSSLPFSCTFYRPISTCIQFLQKKFYAW